MPLDFERVRSVCLSFPGVTEQIQWEHDLLFKVGGKMFSVMPTELHQGYTVNSFKCTEEDFDRLTAQAGIVPAPYLARAKWVALEDFAALGSREHERLLRTSYDLVVAKLPKRVREGLSESMPRPAVDLEDEAFPSMASRGREEQPRRRGSAKKSKPSRRSARAADRGEG